MAAHDLGLAVQTAGQGMHSQKCDEMFFISSFVVRMFVVVVVVVVVVVWFR